ncbi:MAG: GNAT family N-acetyltransferase [Methyloligellaceae bacterium]
MIINKIEITPYVAEREADLQNFLQTCWRDTYGPVFGNAVANRLSASIEGNLKEVIPHRNIKAYLAQIDEKIVGSIVLAEPRDIAYIWGMYISADYHRKGIGRRLICHAAEKIKTAKEIQISVLTKRVSAQKFYESLGFTGQEKSWVDLVKGFQVEVFTKSIAVSQLKNICR